MVECQTFFDVIVIFFAGHEMLATFMLTSILDLYETSHLSGSLRIDAEDFFSFREVLSVLGEKKRASVMFWRARNDRDFM